jgi:hypothetical protein
VHRVVCELSLLDISGKVVRHTCDNRKCINPLHLKIGIAKDNVKDVDERGRRFKLVTKNLVENIIAYICLGFSNLEISKIIKIDPRRVSEIRVGKRNINGNLVKN